MTHTGPIPIRIFLDSAIREQAQPWLETGVIHGVTTNPTLLRRAGLRLDDLPELARWAGDEGREVCVQLWGRDAEQQYASAMRLRELVARATIKVPVGPVGASVARRLQAQGIPVLLTAVCSPAQALVASALSVRYLAPYVSRMAAHGRDGIADLARMTQAIPQDGSGPLVMAASVKSAGQVMQLVGVGVRVFTLAPAVLAEIFADPLTEASIGGFEDDIAALLHG